VLAPDTAQSVAFLSWWRPGGPWVLVAIPPDQAKAPDCSTLADEASVLSFLEQHADWNVYFAVNPLLRAASKKPTREDVRELAWLHVDVDPRVGEPLDSERARIHELLRAPPELPPPSAVVFSGGGYQAFWRLEEPVPINGQPDLYEDAKRYNLQLELLLGGDSCHNVDRIMRLPGTVNWPNRKKRERGRVPELARLVSSSGDAYPISRFLKAPDLQAPGAGGFSGGTVKVSDNVRRLETLDGLPRGCTDYLKMVIAQGGDPDDPLKWTSRSECLWWVCCELVRQGADDDTIYAIITDKDWGISAHVLAQHRGAQRCALRHIERARENAVDPHLADLNERYAVAKVEGRVRVISEERDSIGGQERKRIHYMSFQDFANYYCNQTITWQVTAPSGRTSTLSAPVGKWWLNHPMRRQYESVVFAPEQEVSGSYNLWKGFAYEPRPSGSCAMYLDHLRDVVCSGDQGHYDYLIRWMATCVQRPAQPGHVAVVLRGGQGTGKGTMAKHFGALFGRHYVTVRDSQHLFGQFNAHLRDCLVLFADEAFWAGNKKHEGLLKSLVTEESVMTEGKGRDAIASTNYVHLIMASNESWVVPADVDDRRFFVLDVAASRRQDNAHFRAMGEQMRAGGYEALLHMLRSMDLSAFEVRKAPRTAALQDQKEQSFSAEVDWWASKLRDGRLLEEDDGWKPHALCTRLQHDFATHCRQWGPGTRSTSTKLGKFLQAALPSVSRGQLRGKHSVVQPDGIVRVVIRPYAYVIPPLAECRAHFDANFGGPFTWPVAPLIGDEQEEF